MLTLATLQGCAAVDPALRTAIADATARPDAAARDRLRPFAEQGNGAAIVEICVAYGRSMDTYVRGQERVRAFEWCRLAANAGDVRAQFHLGTFYAQGIGTTEDRMQALHWFQQAAQRGHAGAEDAARGLEGKPPICRNWLTGCRLI